MTSPTKNSPGHPFGDAVAAHSQLIGSKSQGAQLVSREKNPVKMYESKQGNKVGLDCTVTANRHSSQAYFSSKNDKMTFVLGRLPSSDGEVCDGFDDGSATFCLAPGGSKWKMS